MRFVSFVSLAAMLFGGCYNQRPVESRTPPAGMDVVVELTDQGRDELARYLGPRIERVRGKVVSAENGDFVLAVRATEEHDGQESYWKGETVTINRSHIAQLREREISRGRTAVLVAAIVIGAVVIGAAATGASIFGGGGGGGPPVGQ